MKRYRIKEERIGGRSHFYIQNKVLFWWEDVSILLEVPSDVGFRSRSLQFGTYNEAIKYLHKELKPQKLIIYHEVR